MSEVTELEDSITAEIAEIAASKAGLAQAGEVSRSFLCLARWYASQGMLEHAKRKRKAAQAVLTGIFNDD